MASTNQNSKAFIDISIDGISVGRIIFELYTDKLPLTCENFRCLCTGEKTNTHGRKLWYKGTKFFSIRPDLACVGGDIINNNGTTGESIYGKFFEDENRTVSHDQRGILSMMSFKNHTNNSQFFISLRSHPHLDEQHIAFGMVIEGMEILDKIEACGNPDGLPSKHVCIENCGQL